jgi:hypothetical protein
MIAQVLQYSYAPPPPPPPATGVLQNKHYTQWNAPGPSLKPIQSFLYGFATLSIVYIFSYVSLLLHDVHSYFL